MNFRELPESVQIVAAETLREKMCQYEGEKKPAELALEVKEAFEKLYGVSSEMQMQLIECVLNGTNQRLAEILSKMSGAAQIEAKSTGFDASVNFNAGQNLSLPGSGGGKDPTKTLAEKIAQLNEGELWEIEAAARKIALSLGFYVNPY